MKTLHAYLTRQVIASLLMTVAVFTFVLLLGNVLKEILGLLVNRQATLGIVTEAVGLLIPWVLVFALPMGMLSATLLVFGRFSADQELTAVRAGGISLLSLITPILLLGILLSGVSALVNLEIAPRCRVAYKNLLSKLDVELSNIVLPERTFIKDFKGYIFYVGKNRQQNLEDVMVMMLENETNVTMTIKAPRGRFELDLANRKVVLHLHDSRYVRPAGGSAIVGRGDWIGELDLAPQRKARRQPITDLTFWQLQDQLQELDQRVNLPESLANLPADVLQEKRREWEKQVGDMTSPIRVQIHRQIAFSFACFGFTLVGIPLGIRVQRRESNVGFAIALLLVLIYYSFTLLGQALENRPEFAPHLIVWLPNFFFQAAGAVLLWRANRGF